MQTILIPGGSDGLGKVIAARLASNYEVTILSLSEDKLKAVAKELNCAYKVCDVSDYAQVEQAVAEIRAVDCVINNAGLWIQGPLDENDPERVRAVLEVNALGTISLAKAVVPGMKQRKSGRIINIISQAGLEGKAERTVYNASKWAVDRLHQVAADGTGPVRRRCDRSTPR